MNPGAETFRVNYWVGGILLCLSTIESQRNFVGFFFRMSPVSGKYLFSDTDMKEYGGGKRDFFVLTLMVNLYPFF